LARADVPEKVERELLEVISRERWISFSHQMILHGRRVRKARNPDCAHCVLAAVCESTDKVIG
jgi:endonuclease-3